MTRQHPEEKLDIFVSYTHSDVVWACRIRDWLKDAGYNVRMQEPDFAPGANIVSEMHEAIESSTWMVAVLSRAYLDARWPRAEWTAALCKGSLIPVRVEQFAPPGLLAPLKYIDLVGKDEQSARRELLEKVGQAASGEASPPCHSVTADSQLAEPGCSATSLRGRDYRGTVSAFRFKLPNQGKPPPVALDVLGDGSEASVRVYFHQTVWAARVESHGSATEFELPVRTDACEYLYKGKNGAWVELAAAYLTSEEKPVLIVKTQVDAALGDRVCVYDVLLKAGGVSTDRLLDAEVGWGGSPVVLMPNRIEIRHCCHPESKLAGYTWMSGRFVADPADTLGEW